MGLPVLSIAQMRRWENATWATGITEEAVIDRVGERIAQWIHANTDHDARILFLAGKGHNGDDARAASKFLPERQHTVLNVSDPAEALAAGFREQLSSYDLVVDALFGIGINRPLNMEWRQLIQTVNESSVSVLSIDVPSGLNADTGEAQGAAIHASTTLTVGAPKLGLLSPFATEWVGRLEVADNVGLLPCPETSDLTWVEASDFRNFPPPRKLNTHKGTYGHLAIFAGSLGYHGAAVLAARGALKAQPGLVSVFTQHDVYLPVASQLQAPMVHPWQEPISLPRTTTAILIGPGLADPQLPERFKDQLRSFWTESPLPVIADASALDWLPAVAIRTQALRVITPHPGEAARMSGTTSDAIEKDRPGAIRALSARFGNCRVVLKGHQTLIGQHTGALLVNSSGNPHLAQGGSGDVLAGYLSGLLAQPALQQNPNKTIGFAVWQHGATAEGLSKTNPRWTTEDLAGAIGNAKA